MRLCRTNNISALRKKEDGKLTNKRCVFLAIDGRKSKEDVMALVDTVMTGPMEPYMTGVKLNDALHAPWGGIPLLEEIDEKYLDLVPFVDLKLADIKPTVVSTVAHYQKVCRELIVTVSVHVSAQTFLALDEMPGVHVACMGVPTDISGEEFIDRYVFSGETPAEAMGNWYNDLMRAYHEQGGKSEYPTELAITSFDMLGMYQKGFSSLKLILPGIRDSWMSTGDQKRVIGVKKALEAGVTYVVMGNQLYKGNPDAGISALESQARTAAEIERFFAKNAAQNGQKVRKKCV